LNGANNPPDCNDWTGGCTNGATNPPLCNNGNGGWEPQCSDKEDNDGDTLKDVADPNCHIDGDLNKAYVPTHFSESDNPPGGFGEPDLRAGAVFPTVATVNNPTTLSSLITNSGGSTEHEFSNFFSITKTDPSPQGGGNGGGNISKLKKTLNKIFDKLSFTSKANAAPGGNTPPESTNAEIIVVMQTLGNFGVGTTSISHTFTTTGEYFVRVCADKKSPSDTGTVDESNENNNCGLWTTITVSNSLPTICPNGTINPPDCTILPNGLCYNGASNPPECDSYNQCTNGTTNYPLCTVLPDGSCKNGASNPPECDFFASSEINACMVMEKFPIEFTDEEKAQLAELLRKFYLLAPTLKTEEDIMSTYLEKDEWKNLVSQVGSLKTQCYAQVEEQNIKAWKSVFRDCSRDPLPAQRGEDAATEITRCSLKETNRAAF
jgi:hypothetical protein